MHLAFGVGPELGYDDAEHAAERRGIAAETHVIAFVGDSTEEGKH